MTSVSKIMNPAVITLSPDDSLERAVELMDQHDVSGLFVREGAGVVGTLTRSDLVTHLARGRSLRGFDVRELMSRKVHAVSTAAPLDQCVSKMVFEGVHRLLVQEGAQPAGVVSAFDVLRALADGRLRLGEGTLSNVVDAQPTGPSVDDYMTPSPYVIESRESLAAAHRMMQAHGIRHLPVLEEGAVVGVVSAGELYLAENLPGVDADVTPVRVAMRRELIICEPGTPLSVVAAQMLDRREGSAVVMSGGEVKGVLTTTDTLRALIEALARSTAASAG